jgi:hypothetical protein
MNFVQVEIECAKNDFEENLFLVSAENYPGSWLPIFCLDGTVIKNFEFVAACDSD